MCVCVFVLVWASERKRLRGRTEEMMGMWARARACVCVCVCVCVSVNAHEIKGRTRRNERPRIFYQTETNSLPINAQNITNKQTQHTKCAFKTSNMKTKNLFRKTAQNFLDVFLKPL